MWPRGIGQQTYLDGLTARFCQAVLGFSGIVGSNNFVQLAGYHFLSQSLLL